MAGDRLLRDAAAPCERERDVVKQHDDPPASALAHGPTKPSDIERVRDDVARARQRVATHVMPRSDRPAAARGLVTQARGRRRPEERVRPARDAAYSRVVLLEISVTVEL
jgi:hypothetical protein